MVADTADGADGVVDSVLAHGRYPDGPRSQPPLAAESNFNPECAEERLCPAQLLSFAHTNETNIGPLGRAQGVIGLSQRKRRNRAKSPSVEQPMFRSYAATRSRAATMWAGSSARRPRLAWAYSVIALGCEPPTNRQLLPRSCSGAAVNRGRITVAPLPLKPGPWKGPATSLGKPGRNAPRKLVFRLDPPALTQR